MKKGDIVRRKAKDGKPIGPYLQVTHIQRSFICVNTIGCNDKEVLLLKDNVYVCSMASLPVSEYVLRRLNSGEQIAIEHPVNKPWNKVYDNPPDLIRVYTLPRCNESIFVVERVSCSRRQYFNFGKSDAYIRVVISNKVK